MTEPVWLSVAKAIDINKRQVARTGEDHLVRDLTLLLGIAQNRPFLQGNKRTGFHAALQFLRRNGYVWAGPNDRAIADSIVATITGDLTEDRLFETLRPCIRPL